jgi:RHS repeat-associated protein
MSAERGIWRAYAREASVSSAGLSRPGRRPRQRLPRLATWTLAIWLPLAGLAPAAGATASAWPSISLAGLFSALTAGPPHWGHVPRQQAGTAAHRPHAASAGSTRAGRGTGRPPGRGAGQLAGYAPLKPRVAAGPSGQAVTGFNARTSRRIASKSTATSDYYQNADGSYTRRLSQSPVNYQTAPGTWQPINTGVVKGPDGRWHEKANSLAVSFAASSADPAVATLGIDPSHSVASGLTGAAAVAPVVSGSTVSYPGVLPETDLVVQPTTIGLKESLVLHSARAPDRWTFPLALTGLAPVQARDGSIDLVDASGQTKAVIPPAYAFDSKVNPVSGEPATTDAVSYQLTTVAGHPVLVATLDPAWLHDPARVFPVTVDPSTYSANAVTTYAESNNPGNHSAEETIKIGSYDAGPDSANSFLEFPGTGLDGSKATVSAASLTLFDTWASTCTAERFDVAAVTSAWTPSTVTSYPGPAHGASIGNLTPSVPQACANTAADRSVGNQVTVTLSTATFQGWANGTTADDGLEVYAATTDDLHWKQFDTDYAFDNGPFLYLTYTGVFLPQVSEQGPANGYAAQTLTPQLTVEGHVDPNLGVKAKFDFQIDNASGTKIADSGLLTSSILGGSGFGLAAWTVPAGDLQWGQSYYWTVQAYDGTNYSPGAVWNALEVEVPQPAVTSSLSQNSSRQGFDPAIGNYTTEATDAQVSTAGPSLSVVRDYNSRDPRTTGAFGAAWSSVFDAKATEQYNPAGAVSSVVVTYPDGSDVGYGKNSSGTFSPPQGRFATLRSVTGGYTLTDKDDTVYAFTQSLGSGIYGITSITDASGRALNFTWVSGEITAMTSATSGRALHLTWSTPAGATSPHVATVSTDPVTAGQPATAPTWTYSYSGDELSSVCPPGTTTACTQYGYTAGSQYRSQVLDEGASSLWPLSETSGTTAASAVLSNEGSDNGTYSNVTLGQPGPLAGSSATAAGFNGTSSYVQLPDLSEGMLPAQTISLWFKTTTAPGVLFSYSDMPLTSPAYGNINPALYIGTDGKLNGALWYGNFTSQIPTIVSSAAVDDGQWHHVVLAGSYNAQTMWLDGKLVGTAAGSASATFSVGSAAQLTHVYLGAGFLGQYWPDEPNYGPNLAPVNYFSGSIADAAFFTQPLTQGDVTPLYAAGTNAASLLSSVTLPSGKAYAAISYNPLNATVTQVTDQNGGVWKLAAPTVAGSSQVYRSAVLGAGPAGYWRLGEPAGATQAADEVNDGPGSYSGVTLGAAGPFQDETAASFNGSSSYLTLPAGLVSGKGNQSVSLWFKTTATGGVLFASSAAAITSGTTSGNYVPELYVGTNGDLDAEFWTGSAAPQVSSTPVDDGKWHNVVLAAGTTSQTLYLDGKVLGTKTGTTAGTGQPNVYLGAGFIGGSWPNEPHSGAAGTATYFNGSIGDVAFYDSQLSGAQVTGEYAAAQNSAGLAPMTTVKVTDPGGNVITDEYDPLNSNRMIATIDALGHETSYGYDTSGFLYTETNPDGDVTTTGHDVRGNMVSETACQDQAAGKCSTVYYTYYPDDTTAQLTTADPRNDMVLTVRDGRSASASDNTYLTSYSYNTAGDVTGVTTPPVTGFPNGRSTTITYSDGTSSYPAADSGNVPAGLPVKTVSPGGAVSLISYYHDGDIAETTNADGLTTSYTYDNLGRVLTKTEVSNSYPAGLTTSYTYDGQGRVLTETDPPVTDRVTGAIHTAQTTIGYDADGNITSQTVADLTGGDASRTVTTAYNQHDEVSSSTDADNVTTSYGYDGYGNQVKEVDGNGNEIDSSYDPDGNLLTQTLVGYTGDPANPSPPVNLVESSRAYDPAGRLASLTDSMGNTTHYTYTDNGLTATTTRTNAAGTSSYTEESDSYDAAGNLIQKITNNGATTTNYTVDAADRTTTTVLDPAGADRTTTVSYTPDDQAATVTQSGASGATQVTSATYDPMGNLTSESLNSAGAGHPVGWWPLNQTSGTAVPDASGTGNTATATSGVTWSGGAATFPGTWGSDIATNGPVVDTAASFSVSAWVNLAGNTSEYQGVVSEHSTNEDGFRLQYDEATGNWDFGRASADVSAPTPTFPTAESAAPAQTGTWTLLTGVYDASSGQMTLYVNGTASADTATDTTPFAANGPLAVGSDEYAGVDSDYFDGQIDNVQVYQRALSPAQISALYTAGRSGGTTASSPQLTTSWTLDQRGLPTSMTDPDGNVTGYVYDEAGQLAVTTGPAVNAETGGGTPVLVHPVTSTGYDTFGEPAETEDPDGNVTTTAYDADGNPVSKTLPSYTPPGSSAPITATSLTKYDNLGQVTAATDPLGNKTSYTYDQLGDVATVTAPDGGVTQYTYDTNGDQLSDTGPTGAVTEATYDDLGRPLTSTVLERYPTASTLTTTNSYAASAADPGGAWLASSTTPDGVATSYAYDNLGEVTAVTDGAGNKTSYSYDFLGRQTETVNADGTATTAGYDQLGDLVASSQLDAAGNVLASQSATYDGDGDMLSSTDARGDTTTFSYDAGGQLADEVQPVTPTSAITTSFGYDAAGNATRYTDGRGNPWIKTYNSWNLPESVIEPETATADTPADSTFTTAYDADGQPVSQTQPGGVTATATYDQMGNLTGQSGSGADAPTATRDFGYDLAGNMTSASTSAAGSAAATDESFSYNDRGELLTASGTAGSASFSYNGDGLMTSETDAAGTTGYTYDGDDRLATLTDPATGSTLSYAYNQMNQVSQIQYGSGQDVRTFGYDGLHRLTSDTLSTASGATVASIGYGYDADGNLTSKTTAGFAAATTNTYTYDEANRLTSWDNGTTTTGYGYDASGNRTQVGSAIYTYDARDELTSDGSDTYTYTARGTLASDTSSAGTANYTFDAYGQETTAGQQAYAYDALGRMIAVTSPSGSSDDFSYPGTATSPASDGVSTYTWDPSGDLVGVGAVGQGQSAGVLALTDQHTDVVGDFTPAGTALSASTSYDPFGNVTATTGQPTGKLGYQSAWTDSSTGQVNMAARWYNPAAGQFTSKDTTSVSPVPNSVAANPFSYVDDNPLTRTDPTGDSFWGDVTSTVSRGWHAVTSTVSRGWHDVTSAVSSAWDSTTSWISREIAAANRAFEAEMRAIERQTEALIQEIKDEAREIVVSAARTVHTVAHAATHVVHTVTHAVTTAYHEVKQVSKATASFVKNHEAAIVSFAAGAAVFAGCEGLTLGIGTVGCAAAAGAVGGLVSYGMSCGSTSGGCSVSGALVSAGVGALGGALGGALAGPLGGKLASSVLGDLLPDLAVQGLTGATVGAVSGGVAGAAAYGLTCKSSREGCSLSGLASATASTAAGGALTGGALSVAAGVLSSGASGEQAQPATCGGMSFTANTKVLVASGAAVPISALKVGEKVLATSTKTGKTTAETVAAVLVHYDTNRYDLRVRTAGGPAVIGTTRNHLFWNQDSNRWVKAAALKHGTHLRVPGRGTVTVAGGHAPRNATGWMWDLTVPGDHDFYVQAATTAILAHNCGDAADPDDLLEHTQRDAAASPTNNFAASVAKDPYTGTTEYGESGALPGNVNPELTPRLRAAEELVDTPYEEEDWKPGTCAEFHSCNNLLNAVSGLRLSDIQYATVVKETGLPYPSCGWCRMILGGEGGAQEVTSGR